MGEQFNLHPEGVYQDGDLILGLGLTEATLAKACRAGELKYARKGRRRLYRGEWVVQWLEADSGKRGGSHE